MLLFIATITLIAGCLQAQSPHEQLLRSARSTEIHERFWSIGKDYDVKVGGQAVATVSGKDIKILGDVFTLKTLDGNVLASEQEHKRFLSLSRAASIRNAEGQVTGYLGEQRIRDFFSLSYIFHIYDAEQQEVGRSVKFTNSSLGSHEILDDDGSVDYRIDKHWVLLGGDQYTLEVLDSESPVSLWAAILLVCIEDAIGDAHEDD